MTRVEKAQQIFVAVNNIRGLKRGYITNLYADAEKIECWVSLGLLSLEQYEEVTFILKQNNDCFNVYYCATTVSMLEDALNKLNKRHGRECLLFDVVGNHKQCFQIKSAFESKGFSEYVSLMRMSRKTPEIDEFYCRNKYVNFASNQDSFIVYEMLSKHFDYRAEQLPMLKDIVSFVSNNQILVYKELNEIWGFAVFEKSLSTLYLRYWFILPQYRDKKIGSALLREFFNQGVTTKRQLFWVIQSNENATKRYKHYGFEPEDMFDYILVNKDIRYE